MAAIDGLGNLAHIGIFVKNLETSLDYYIEKLGFERTCDYLYKATPRDARIAFVALGTLVIELIENGDDFSANNRESSNHIAMACRDIEATRKALEERGIVFEEDTVTSLMDFGENGCRFAMFRGPDGERLEIQELL